MKGREVVMRKQFVSKISFLASVLLLLQLLMPVTSLAAETINSTILPPSNLAYQLVTPSDVKLTWSSVYDATGYNIYGIIDGQLIVLATTKSTTYTFNNLDEGTHTYVVSTLTSTGESGPGAPVTVDIVYPVMQAPSSLTYSIKNGNDISLNWTSSPYTETYNLYQVTSDDQVSLVTSTKNLTYTIVNAPEGNYTYMVSAANARYGDSTYSTPVQVNLVHPAMSAPSNFTYTVTNGNDINLKWNAVTFASNYNVYQMIEGQKVLKSSVTGTSVSYSNQPAGDYQFEVYSNSDRFGESSVGSALSLTLGDVELTAPSNLSYKLQNINDVVLSWGKVTNATSYKIYQLNGDEKVLRSTVTGTSVTFTNQLAGDYVYEVHSYSDRFGESSEGSQIAFAIGSVTMVPPTNLTYKFQNVNDAVLSWTAAPNANSYKVYQLIDGQKVLKSTVTSTSVTYTNLPAGNYMFEVYSFSDRFGESNTGSQVSFVIDEVTMAAPSNLDYTIRNGNDIVLTWGAVPNANNYKVYQVVNGQKVLKSTLSSTTLTVTYPNLPAGEYQYIVHSSSTRFGESEEGSEISISLTHPMMQAPEDLVYTINNATDFTLSWAATDYATSYKVYQIVNGQKVLKSTVTTTSVKYTKMTPGEYVYQVYSVSSRFGESAQGSQITFTLSGQTMDEPTNLTYSIANGNDITLKWGAVNYATSYKVYQIVDGEMVLKSTVTSTSVTYSNQPVGDYEFVVHSFSTLLGESPNGTEIAFTLVHPTMAAPANLTYKVQNGNDIVLSWGAVQYANNYKVYELVDGEKSLKSTVTSTSSTLSKVPFGEHTYVVHSVSTRFGESVEGSSLSMNLAEQTMIEPANFTFTILNGNDIRLNWDAVTYATNYKVYQIVNDQLVLKTTTTSRTVTYTNQPEGEYVFVVHSYSDRFGESQEGSEIAFTLVFPIMQAPANVTHSIANGNDITLRWNAATYATNYRVYQIANGQKTLKSTVTGTSVTYTNMPEGNYTFEIHSYSTRFGESPEAGVANFALIWPVVQPPVLAGTVYNANNITFSWKAVQWANEYRVYEVKGESRTLLYKGTALTTTVYNLTEDTHQYEMTAYSTRFGESAPSNRIVETIVYPVMQAPVASLQLLSTSSARISWGFVTYSNGYNIYEIIDGNPVLLVKNLNNLSYTLTDLTYADHEYYVTSYSNSFGESEASNIVLAKLIVDTEAPVTTAIAPTGWTNESPVVVTLTASDNETGVAHTYYALNDGGFVEGTSITIHEVGITKVSYYSVDKVGNREEVRSIYVNIDQVAPVTASDVPTTWSNGDVTVNLFAKDDLSEVAKTYYSINKHEYNEGTTFTISEEGKHTVRYYSVDAAGNIEDVQTAVVMIDKTAPVTVSDAPTTWSNSDVTVNLITKFDLSGVAKTYYAINDSEYSEGTTFTLSKEGKHTIRYYSVDVAGNVEEVQTAVVMIDKTAPTVTMNLGGEYKLGDSIKLEYLANDPQSGIVAEQMVVFAPNSQKGSVLQNGSSIRMDQPGVYKISVTVTNGAGLTTTIQKEYVTYIQATIEVTPNVIKGNNGVFTVRVTLPKGYSTNGFDLNTATINGVNALNSNNGYYNQAKQGQFKFERSDFNWVPSEVVLEFRGYVDGHLVVGQTKVKVQK